MRTLALTVAAILVLVYAGAKFYLHYKTRQGMEQAVERLAPIMEVRYGGVGSTMTGELTIEDMFDMQVSLTLGGDMMTARCCNGSKNTAPNSA